MTIFNKLFCIHHWKTVKNKSFPDIKSRKYTKCHTRKLKGKNRWVTIK